MAMCRRVTKLQPYMWGPSIVGYGSYTYRYESGHSGDASLAASQSAAGNSSSTSA